MEGIPSDQLNEVGEVRIVAFRPSLDACKTTVRRALEAVFGPLGRPSGE